MPKVGPRERIWPEKAPMRDYPGGKIGQRDSRHCCPHGLEWTISNSRTASKYDYGLLPPALFDKNRGCHPRSGREEEEDDGPRGVTHAVPWKKDSPAKLAKRMKRRWRVVLLRNRGEILGEVEAADVASAKAAAADQLIWTKSSATGLWCRSWVQRVVLARQVPPACKKRSHRNILPANGLLPNRRSIRRSATCAN
jgi:hypothetical protein